MARLSRQARAAPVSRHRACNRLAKGVSAGLDYREADAASKANAEDNKAMIAALLGGAGNAPASVAAAGTVPAAVANAPSPDAFCSDDRACVHRAQNLFQ